MSTRRRKSARTSFYFNDPSTWDASWGGSTLVLCDRTTEAMDPDFDDLGSAVPVQTLGNHSFLFRNEPDGWHGVKPVQCPEGAYRRLFNVIFVVTPQSPTMVNRVRGKLRRLVKS